MLSDLRFVWSQIPQITLVFDAANGQKDRSSH
jgi:hypothetical protein